MSVIEFAPAKREQVKARVALIGPSGSGKTLGALQIARALDEPTFGIDTENGRMKLYADRFTFSHGNLHLHTPEAYTLALRAAIQAGAGTVVFDSLSHEWLAILSEADRFSNWKELTPRHHDFVHSLVNSPCHVIVTMRAKTKYEVEEVEEGGRKKQRITRIGVGPVFREGMEYEFDLIGMIDDAHEATWYNRCDALVGKTLKVPEAIPLLLDWLAHGEPDPGMERAPAELVAELRALLTAEGQPDAVIDDAFNRIAVRSGGVLTLGWVQGKIAAAHERAAGGGRPADAPKPPAVPKTWAEARSLLTSAWDDTVVNDVGVFVNDLALKLTEKPVEDPFGSRGGNLNRAEWAKLQQQTCGAVARLVEAVDRQFPPPTRLEVQAAFAPSAGGEALPGPYWRMSPDEEERPVRRDESGVTPEEQEEAERLAKEFEGIEFGGEGAAAAPAETA